MIQKKSTQLCPPKIIHRKTRTYWHPNQIKAEPLLKWFADILKSSYKLEYGDTSKTLKDARESAIWIVTGKHLESGAGWAFWHGGKWEKKKKAPDGFNPFWMEGLSFFLFTPSL